MNRGASPTGTQLHEKKKKKDRSSFHGHKRLFFFDLFGSTFYCAFVGSSSFDESSSLTKIEKFTQRKLET